MKCGRKKIQLGILYTKGRKWKGLKLKNYQKDYHENRTQSYISQL